jgi:hypothetical protein
MNKYVEYSYSSISRLVLLDRPGFLARLVSMPRFWCRFGGYGNDDMERMALYCRWSIWSCSLSLSVGVSGIRAEQRSRDHDAWMEARTHACTHARGSAMPGTDL